MSNVNNVNIMTNPVVTVQQGQLRGKTSADYHGGTFYSFCGIPYAKAPIGDLRFKAPQPAEPWEGIRDATKEGWECPSLDMYFNYYIGCEDNCLNVNVHTKSLPSDNTEKRPVMVWIHGGGFLYGSNKNELYGANYLMTEDIVLVAINYRLGVFGFLSLEDEFLGVTGNAGLKDQTLALKWVQQNIHNFGGDPLNVTIFGESAGGASVHYLMLSPLTKGLFQKAIIQSGSSLNLWARGKRNTSEIVKCFGYKDTDEKIILQKLQKESAKNIVFSQFKINDDFKGSSIRPWGPVVEANVDGAFLTEEPLKVLRSGKNHQIPMIIGYNSLEGFLFELIRRTRNYVGLPKQLEVEIPYDLKIPAGSEKSRVLVEKINQFYYNGEDVTEKNITSTYLLEGDIQFVYGIQKAIRLQRQSGNQHIYVYRNSLDGPLNFFKKFCSVKYFKTMILFNFLTKMSGTSSIKSIFQSLISKLPTNKQEGVAHADDLFYLFPTFFTPKILPESKEDIYIQRFLKLWTNFAKYGNPTPEAEDKLNKVTWKPIESEHIEILLEIGEELKLIKNLDEERMKFWDDIYDQSSND